MNTCVLISWTPASFASGIVIAIAIAGAVGGEVVTYGKNTAGSNQCYGTYNSTSQNGWGPAYQYNCIHSGTIVSLGDLPTTWYNYSLATASTIIDEDTTSSNPATNTTEATESICPKGWTLPNKTQIDSQRDTNSFSPVYGGGWGQATLYGENNRGRWWGSEAYNGARRYILVFAASLNTGNLGIYGRSDGLYIRCVQAS